MRYSNGSNWTINPMNSPQPGTKPSLERADWAALAGLLGFTALLLWRFLFVWPTPLLYPEATYGTNLTDLSREVWPVARFVVDTLRQTGELPLWRPYLLSGSPIIGHPVAPILYPPNWIMLVLPLPLSLSLSMLLHLWWAGVGTYAVLRLQYATRREAAFVGALLFGLSPKWIAHFSGGHWPMMAAMAWWPWVWLGFARYWTTKHVKWSVLLGLALAMQALNMGQFFVFSAVWVGVCTLGFLRPTAWLTWVRDAAVGWGVALVVLLGLTAGQLWPLFELLSQTTRTALTQSETTFGAFPPVILLATFFPPKLKFPEWFLYPGAVALLLVMLSWLSGWSRRERWWVAGALVALMLSLGENIPLHRLYYLLPGLSLFRVPARWWMFTLFAVALLAAWGAEKWLNEPVARTLKARMALAIFGVFYLSASALQIAAPGILPFDVIPATLALLLAGLLVVSKPPSGWTFAAVIAILFADLWWTAAGLIQPLPETVLTAPDDVAAFLQPAAARGERSFSPYGGLPENTLAHYDLRAADGLSVFQLAHYAALAQRAGGCDFEGYALTVPSTSSSPEAAIACPVFDPEPRLLALLNVRYVILPAPQEVPGATLVMEDTDGERYVYDLGPGLGRAFGVSQGEVASEEACLDRLLSVDPAVEAIIETPLPFEADVPPLNVVASEAIVNGEVFTVRADQAGLLVRSEAWAPGWKATVDGQAVDVLRVDCALQGVWLEGGEHEVRFEYLPDSYAVGRWVSLATAMALATWAGWLIYRARRSA
jgi:hypothetical protein